MRLTDIKLAGFKSFVDPTTLRLTSNLTGVVGPNGCGKSNIIDAVRWVTGESSAKQLRGEALEDVIFNGSKARKPVGRASIELKFDNSDGKLGGEYAGFSEIAVRRELSRDGGSRYYLNGSRCRRRDVVDLFLGTGLGGRSNYAVIEQGSVHRLIEARPEEMRQVLEEAAGISKYKERRRETENRIRRTRENLERLNDLISEVTQRLGQLQRQARNAEKYKQYRADVRKLRAELLALRWRALNAETERHQAQLVEQRDQLEQARGMAREATQRREALAREQQDAAHECQRRQGEFYAAEAEVSRVEQALAHARELAAVRTGERDDAMRRRADVDTHLDRERQTIEELTRTLANKQQALEAGEVEEAAARAELETAEGNAQDGEAEWDGLSGDEANPLQRAEAQRARVEHLEQTTASLAQRVERQLGERERIEDQAPQTALEEADQALRELTREMEAARDDHQAAEARLEQARATRSDVDGRLYQSRQQLADSRGRLSSLDALQQASLREDDSRIREWLGQHGLDQAAGVAHAVRVTDGWETAAEAALGGFLRAFCVPDLGHSRQTIGDWPEQCLTLLDADTGELTGKVAGGPAHTRSLATVLQGPVALRRLARQVFLVEDESAAQAALPALADGQMLVTRDGLCFGPGWLSTPTQSNAEHGVLEREQVIARLRGEVERLTAAEADLAAELEGVRARITGDEAQRSEQSQHLDGLRRRHGERLAERQGLSVRIEQNQRRRRELASEIEELRTQHGQRERELSEAREHLEQSTEAARDFVRRRQTLQDRLRSLRETRDATRRRREILAEQQQSLRVDLAGRRSALAAAEQRLADLQEQRTRLNQRVSETEAALEQALAPDHQSAPAKAEAEQRLDSARKALEAARTALADAEARVEHQARRVQEGESAVDNVRDAVQQAQVAYETAAVRRQTLEEQLAETGHAPESVCEQLPENAEIPAWEQQVEALDRRIQRLGAINLAAIEEFQEEKQREEHLQAEHDDLTGALETLEKAIDKIDRETRSRFRVTYEQVNQRLGSLFPTLFGGGEARLELTEDDLLATGVRVMARPPGKRNASIQMLSGGEKALTAVALLLALFELNPAPFCMLDEIDAPLDDSNVARFCELVRKMSEHVQFIVITHNKVTMEMAHQLHGVTMQEPGVSRLVSVDVDEALEMAG